MEKELSPQESLSIISNMIEKTRHSICDNSHYFLLWGYAVFIGSIAQYTLIEVGFERNYYAWFILLPVMVTHIYLVIRDGKKEKFSTYISEANGYLWMGLGFCFMAIIFIFSKIGWQYSFPFYVLMYALGTFVSGSLIKFKPMIIGGGICFIVAAVMVYTDYRLQILLTAFSVLVSYIIPGHILRMRYKKQKA